MSEGANPSECEIKKAYRKLVLQYHPDKHSDASKDVQKQNEEKFKELGAAYKFFTGKDTKEVTNLTDENLDEIHSIADLKFYLYEAISEGNTAFLKNLFSKFKSSKDEKFGDYINDNIYRCQALILAVIKGGKIEIIKLLLKHGANPNVQSGCGGDTALLAHIMLVLPRNADSTITKLLLKHNADPNIKNNSGGHILYWACDCRNGKVVELLLKYGA